MTEAKIRRTVTMSFGPEGRLHKMDDDTKETALEALKANLAYLRHQYGWMRPLFDPSFRDPSAENIDALLERLKDL
jgi:hypothetical protein